MSLGKRYVIDSYNNMQDLTRAGVMGKSRKHFKYLSEVIIFVLEKYHSCCCVEMTWKDVNNSGEVGNKCNYGSSGGIDK